jgi:hypothetical protein
MDFQASSGKCLNVFNTANSSKSTLDSLWKRKYLKETVLPWSSCYLPLWRWGAWGWRPDEVHSLATSWIATRSHPETHATRITLTHACAQGSMSNYSNEYRKHRRPWQAFFLSGATVFAKECTESVTTNIPAVGRPQYLQQPSVFIFKLGLTLTITTLMMKFTTILMIININNDSRIPEDSRLLRHSAVSLQL